MKLSRKTFHGLFEQAETWLNANASSALGGILNVDGVATYIYLRRGYPPRDQNEDREELQIIDYNSHLSADHGYIVGQPDWDFDDALSAICIEQLLTMHAPRYLSSAELSCLCSKILRVYKRQNALFPNSAKTEPQKFREAISKRASRFRNAVSSNHGAVVGEPTTSGKTAKTAEYQKRSEEGYEMGHHPRQDASPRRRQDRKRTRINREMGKARKKQAGEASIGSA